MKRRERDARLAQVIELRDTGAPFSHIAATLGVSKTRTQQLYRAAERKPQAGALRERVWRV
jgi:transposase-like protein